MEIELKKWMTSIVFEGEELSPISIAIDHLGMYGNLPGLSEEISEWLWKFTICRGVNKEDKSVNINLNVIELLSMIKIHRHHLLENVPLHFDGEFLNIHLDMWINDWNINLGKRKTRRVCKGTAKEERKLNRTTH